MKAITWSFLFIFSLSAQAAALKINLKPVDIESNLCIQELEIKGKKNTTYFFVTMRKSKMKKSFYWNSVSFLNTKKEDVNKNLIKRIRAELEKNNI